MKKFLIKLIELYQATPGNWHYHCRFIPTCSQYAKEAIEIHGSWIGSKLTIKRLLRCRPFGKHGYDHVPSKDEI